MAINFERLKSVVLENQRLPESWKLVERGERFEPSCNYVLIGMRRVGKTFTLYEEIQRMIREGEANREDIIFLNFEDERLSGFEAEDFERILEAYAQIYGSVRKPLVFLDELQNIPGWEKFVRRLADHGYRVFVTGSNAKMLSREIYSTLGGRFLVRTIRPFSFSEYLRYLGVKPSPAALYGPESADVRRHFDAYFEWGGLSGVFPLSVFAKREWLQSVREKVLINDIVVRNGIRKDGAVRLLVRKLAESVMQPTTLKRLVHSLESAHFPTTRGTVTEWLDSFENAFLITSISNWRDTIPERVTLRKHYFSDNGMLRYLIDDPKSKLFENLVAQELIRRFGHEGLYFYRDRVEVDFFMPENRLAVQASVSIHDADTLERESEALVRLAEAFDVADLLILTMDDERDLEIRGHTIRVRRLWKWLLEKEWNPNASS